MTIKYVLHSLVKHILILWLRLVSFLQPRRNRIKSTEIKNILVFGYFGIGDMIMYTPTLKLLRQQFPNAKITLQTGLNNACELVVKHSNIFDTTINRPLNKQFFKFMRDGFAQQGKYDLLISEFHHGYFELALQTVFMRIPYRIGHISSPGFSLPFSFIFNFPIQMNKDQHTIERNLRLLRPFGITVDPATFSDDTMVFLSPEQHTFAEKFWIDTHLMGKKVFGIQAGTAAFGPWKKWPADKFKQLIKQLNQHRIVSILFGSPAERPMLEKIAAGISPAPIIAAGNSSFLEACALIARCDYMITNDSGLMHVANALDVPLSAIFGPTDFHRTAPLGRHSHMVCVDLPCRPCFRLKGDTDVKNCPHKYRCLTDVTVEQVLASIPPAKISPPETESI